MLDGREMAGRDAAARLKLLPGGDHPRSDFATHLPDGPAFPGLPPDP